ncbi:MAG: hypothetical protein WCK67_12070 [bacterium]
MMNTLIKPSAVLGAILGAALGIILLIPFLNVLGFLAFMLIGVGIVWYLKHYSFIGIITVKDGAIMGAVSGFCATIAASLIYLPFNIIYWFFISPALKTNTWHGPNMVFSYIFISIILVLTAIAPMLALFNALSGMAAAFMYKKIENQQIEGQTEFIIDDTI